MWCSSICLSFFFFFKQRTAYEMRISYLSSDVCSSDLLAQQYLRPISQGSRYSLLRPPTPRASAGALVTTKSVVDEALGELPGWNLADLYRSEERREGKECVSTCRSRWSPYHKKSNTSRHNTTNKNKKLTHKP